jgi:hypothetical protein
VMHHCLQVEETKQTDEPSKSNCANWKRVVVQEGQQGMAGVTRHCRQVNNNKDFSLRHRRADSIHDILEYLVLYRVALNGAR